jgi:hypothetical protein
LLRNIAQPKSCAKGAGQRGQFALVALRITAVDPTQHSLLFDGRGTLSRPTDVDFTEQAKQSPAQVYKKKSAG